MSWGSEPKVSVPWACSPDWTAWCRLRGGDWGLRVKTLGKERKEIYREWRGRSWNVAIYLILLQRCAVRLSQKAQILFSKIYSLFLVFIYCVKDSYINKVTSFIGDWELRHWEKREKGCIENGEGEAEMSLSIWYYCNVVQSGCHKKLRFYFLKYIHSF